MKIVLAGGTGFLGRPLSETLTSDGHELVILTRSPRRSSQVSAIRYIEWEPNGTTGDWADTIDGADAVINLSGESIADRRWSSTQKDLILNSRLLTTRSLVSAIQNARQPPDVLINSSATGYYGAREEMNLTEDAGPGNDFLSRTCVAWEAETAPVVQAGTRLVLIRTGIVLERDGGALSKMLPPFRLFVGGPIGSGKQPMSWIHRADWIQLINWALLTDSVSGPFNGTAPAPVSNAEFSRALGNALGRPSWLPVPAPVLRLALGEMADALLLKGNHVVPAHATKLGFSFRYPEIDKALAAIL
jgi:uncharacterized protein (TIGR01777 family)